MLLSDFILVVIALVVLSLIAGREHGFAFSGVLAFVGLTAFCSFFLVSYGIASII